MDTDLKPGRELDALVAEKVMGWKRIPYQEDFQAPGWRDFESGSFYPDRDGVTIPWFSDHIEDAWKVVEKLTRMPPGHLVDLQVGFSGTGVTPFYQAQIKKFYPKMSGGYWDTIVESTEAETAPHAICLAALKAVGA